MPMVAGAVAACALCIALGAYLSVYPLVLLIPGVLMLSLAQRTKVQGGESCCLRQS